MTRNEGLLAVGCAIAFAAWTSLFYTVGLHEGGTRASAPLVLDDNGFACSACGHRIPSSVPPLFLPLPHVDYMAACGRCGVLFQKVRIETSPRGLTHTSGVLNRASVRLVITSDGEVTTKSEQKEAK